MVKRICLGTVQFGKDYGVSNMRGITKEEEVFRILDFCAKKGIQWLDTAEDYGDSQKVLGKYLKKNQGVFKVQSKVSNDTSSYTLNSRFNQTLEELNIEYLDSYLLHSYEKFESESLCLSKEVTKLKKSGLCHSVGVSIHENNEALDQRLLTFSDEIQFPFNLLDNYTRRGKMLKELKNQNKIIQLRSIFLQGLLLLNPLNLPFKLIEFQQPLLQLNRLAKKYNLSMSQLSICYSLSISYADKILLGVETLHQLKMNLNVIENLNNVKGDVFNEVNEVLIENTKLLNPSTWYA